MNRQKREQPSMSSLDGLLIWPSSSSVWTLTCLNTSLIFSRFSEARSIGVVGSFWTVREPVFELDFLLMKAFEFLLLWRTGVLWIDEEP